MTNKTLTPIRRLFVYLLLAAAFSACSSCEREFQMAPFPSRFTDMNLPKVPLIVVGQALENCHAAAPPEYSGLDHQPYQLWKVRVKVEQIVQGEVESKNLDIFYFVNMGASSGGVSHLTDIQKGHSEIFLLQKDGSHWRTICDGWRSCVLWVRTGTHYHYKIDPNLPIEDTFANLMLGRGDHTSDGQMIDAIYHPVGRWGWAPIIDKLQQLAGEDKSPQVRAVALERLQNSQKYYGKATRYVPQE